MLICFNPQFKYINFLYPNHLKRSIVATSFSFPDAVIGNICYQTVDSYKWNPCIPWIATSLPNVTVENQCKDVAYWICRWISSVSLRCLYLLAASQFTGPTAKTVNACID